MQRYWTHTLIPKNDKLISTTVDLEESYKQRLLKRTYKYIILIRDFDFCESVFFLC